MTTFSPPAAPAAPAGLPGATGTLSSWFLRGLRISRHAEALRIGAHSFSYQWLYDRALALAGDLGRAGGPGPRRVGLLAARSEQAYAGFLAAGFAGAAVVPLNPEFPAERTRQMIAAASLDALIVDARGAAVLPSLGDVLAEVPVIAEPAGRPLAEPRPASADDIAYILFTSGSTGRPKGVPVLHRNVGSYLRFVHGRYSLTSADVFSQTFDLTFDLSVFDLFAGWGCGGTVVCVPPRALATLPQFLAQQQVTVWFSSPSVISLARRLRSLSPGCFPSLRWSLFCGEPLLAHDAADWQAAAPGSRVENLYGPTELTISCSVYRWDPARSPARCVNDIVPIGSLHPGLRYLLHTDGEDPDQAGGPGTSGELCVAGEQMFPGYLDPRDDGGRFLTCAGERWYRTGDLVRRVEGGELVYLGRRDHQVKVRGVRVELAEVEWGLRRVAGIRDAVAAVAGGELAAFCLGERRPPAELAADLGAILPRALVPRRFVFLDEFPLNANRKIDRKELTARAARVLAG